MTTTQTLASTASAPLTHEQIALVKRTIARGATDDELKIFLHVCQARRVDPFSKMLYLVKRYNSESGQTEMALQSSIDYFRLTADRKSDYEGQVGPQWCGPDGTWKDVWLEESAPAASRVGVWRKGFREPLWGTALWSNYVQRKKDGSVTKFWNTMGPLMLAKCAESLAIRRAFPEDLAGLYTAEEMAQASTGEDRAELPSGEGRPITPTPPSKPQAAPVRTVDAQVVRPVQTQQASPQDAQGEAWPRRIFEGCIPGHPGVLIPEKIGANWDTWRREIAVKKEGSTSALANISWQQASEGSDGGQRMQSLKWIVETAIMDKVRTHAPLTEYHLRGAWTLHVMLERIAAEVLDGTDGFAPVEDGPSDAEYDARAAAADVPF